MVECNSQKRQKALFRKKTIEKKKTNPCLAWLAIGTFCHLSVVAVVYPSHKQK